MNMGEYICSVCGEVMECCDTLADGEIMCADCLEENYVQCTDCGKYIPRNDVAYECKDCGEPICGDCANLDGSGEAVCSDCETRYDWTICDDCGDWSNETVYVHGAGQVCDDCRTWRGYFLCSHCEEWYTDDHGAGECMGCGGYVCEGCANYDSEDEIICDGCRDEYYPCDDCGCWVSAWDAYRPDDGGVYCRGCIDDRYNRRPIRSYDYKPDHTYYGSERWNDALREIWPQAWHMGIELEVDKGEDCEGAAREIIDTTGEIYCKHDGSLSHGFEIVSHPATYEYHRDNLKWGAVMRIAKEHGFKSHDAGTCGLHVHVSRTAFGRDYDQRELGITKLLYMVEKYWDQVLKFSRRTEAQADQWAARYCSGAHIMPADELLNAAKRGGRYRAVNLQPSRTVEIRIFRGTLKKSTFLATLQLVKLLVETTQRLTIAEIQALDWNEFINLGQEYAELMEYCAERDLLNVATDAPSGAHEARENHRAATPPPLNADNVQGRYVFDSQGNVTEAAMEAMALWLGYDTTRPIRNHVTTWARNGELMDVMGRWENILVTHYGMIYDREPAPPAELEVVFNSNGTLSDAALEAIRRYMNNIYRIETLSMEDLRQSYSRCNNLEAAQALREIWSTEFAQAGLRDNLNEVYNNLRAAV